MPLDNPALRPAVAALLHGTVCRTGPLAVAVDGLDRPATCAPSCLVAPEPGDEVLVMDGGDRLILLHVVARSTGGGVALTHETGISLRAPALALHAGETLALRAPATLVEGDALTVRATTANVALRSASILAGALRGVADRIGKAPPTFLPTTPTATRGVTCWTRGRRTPRWPPR